MNKHGMSSVVAVALLLVIAVISVVGFQSWFNTFSTSTLSGVESQGSGDVIATGAKTVVGGQLYFNNGYNGALEVSRVTIGGNDCNFSGSLSNGLSNLSLSNNCTQNLSSSVSEVVVYTDKGIFSSKMKVGSVSSSGSQGLTSYSFFETNNSDFSSGIYSSNLTIEGSGDSAVFKLSTKYSEGSIVTEFGNSGAVTSNPTVGEDRSYSITVDSQYVYIAGADNEPGNSQWRVEKRDVTNGSLIADFDTDGIIQTNPTSDPDYISNMELDSDYLYLVGSKGISGGNYEWRIEKRNKSDGSLVTAFDSDGILTVNPSTTALSPDVIYEVAIDSDYIYVAGTSYDGATHWEYDGRIEKRNKTSGALVTAFDSDGIIEITYGASSYIISDIAVDSNYLYISARDLSPGNYQWQIRKFNLTTGALITAFDGDGILSVNPSTGSDSPNAIEIDSNYIYIGGYDDNSGDQQWRLEKRNIVDGTLITAFDGDGILSLNYSSGSDIITDIEIISDALYIFGYDDVLGEQQWRLEKRNLTDGSLITSFNNVGYMTINPNSTTGGNDISELMAYDSNYIYVTGGQSLDGSYGWYSGKVSLNNISYLIGNFTSQIFDTSSSSTQFTTIDYNSTTPSGTSINVTIGAGNVAVSDGTWTWLRNVSNGEDISGLNNNQYVQYKFELSTTDVTTTPTFEGITINYQN